MFCIGLLVSLSGRKVIFRKLMCIYTQSNKNLSANDVYISINIGHDDTSSKSDETDCISHSTNTLGKAMNPIILPPAMSK